MKKASGMKNIRDSIIFSKYDRYQEVRMIADPKVTGVVRSVIFEYTNHTTSFFYMVGFSVKRNLKLLFAGLR